MNSLIKALYDFDALRNDDQISQDVVDRVEPTFADDSIFQQINPRIVKVLRNQGVRRLYEHQGVAIRKALHGSNVVLEAPTASGKTLSFSIPMMQSLLKERDGHALMIYPMKAVAHDQRAQLVDLLKSVGLESWTYDGDTEREHRELIRKNPPDVLITNPEMVNQTFLAWNDLWNDFLKNLRFVVIDEMHEYRGFFGSNMSLLLRRFAHHITSIGASPQYFLATATCANPEEHAQNLTGQDFEIVKASGKISPQRQFLFIDPEIPDYQFYNIFQLRIRNAALACMEQSKSVIVFCPTIRFTNWCYHSALKECESRRMNKDAVKLYQAGITAEERDSVQRGLKDGSVKVVFSTNALELGIDIGGLDGVILAGFPDTVMSAWQRIGRAGRGWDKDAFVFFYAMNNPVDKFHAANLRAFLRKPLDEIVADPGNEELIQNHKPSFVHESRCVITPSSESILGKPFYEAVKNIGSSAVLGGRFKPHHLLTLRGDGGKTWTLKHGNEDVGTMADYRRFREAYVDAILLHVGRKYKVDTVTEGSSNEIALINSDADYLRTDAFFLKTLNIQEVFQGSRWKGQIANHLGRVNLYEALNQVSLVDERSDQVVNRFNPLGHAKSSTTHAFWVDLNELEEIEDEGLGAFEQLLRIGSMFTIPADLHDTTTYSDKRQKQVYLIENYPGGIGIVKKAFEQLRKILQAGMEIVRACKCAKGCPNCIIPPRNFSDRDALDKNKGIELAELVIATTVGSPEEKFVNSMWEKA